MLQLIKRIENQQQAQDGLVDSISWSLSITKRYPAAVDDVTASSPSITNQHNGAIDGSSGISSSRTIDLISQNELKSIKRFNKHENIDDRISSSNSKNGSTLSDHETIHKLAVSPQPASSSGPTEDEEEESLPDFTEGVAWADVYVSIHMPL